MTWGEKKELAHALTNELDCGRQLAVLTRAQVTKQLEFGPMEEDDAKGEPRRAPIAHKRS